MIVPLLDRRPWAATNEALRGHRRSSTATAPGGCSAGSASGQLLDHGRLPVVDAVRRGRPGLAVARWRAEPGARAVLVALAVCLLLSFGRATFGSLVDVIPGSGDIFFRRFMMGVQLGRAAPGRERRRVVRRARLERGATVRARPAIAAARRAPPPGCLALDEPAHGAPADDGRGDRAGRCARAGVARAALVRSAATPVTIAAQRRADAAQGAEIDQLIALVQGQRRRARVRRHAVELGSRLHGRSRSGVQVPGEPRRRRGRIHAAHRVADDRPREPLRRAQPVRLPAVRDPLSDPPQRLAGPDPRGSGRGVRPVCPVDDSRNVGYVHAGRSSARSTADRTDIGARSIPRAEFTAGPGRGLFSIRFRSIAGGAVAIARTVIGSGGRQRHLRERRPRRRPRRRDGHYAPARSRGPERLVRRRLEVDRRRSAERHEDGRARARRDRRPRRHAHGRVSVTGATPATPSCSRCAS